MNVASMCAYPTQRQVWNSPENDLKQMKALKFCDCLLSYTINNEPFPIYTDTFKY